MNPSHYFQQILDCGQSLARHASEALKNARLAKNDAWLMAKALIDGRNECPNELHELMKAHGGVDEFLRMQFLPLTRLGENYLDLLVAVQKGLTRQAYINTTAAVFLCENKPRRDRPTESDAIPPDPSEELPLEDRYQSLLLQCRNLKARLREEERLGREQAATIARLSLQVKRLSKILANMQAAVPQ